MWLVRLAAEMQGPTGIQGPHSVDMLSWPCDSHAYNSRPGSASVSGRPRRSRSAGRLRRRTGTHPPAVLGVRLVQTRSGWRPTPLKDFRSSFEIQTQAKEEDAARVTERWAQVSDSQRASSSCSSQRPGSSKKTRGRAVSATDFVKRPGRAAQSRAIKQHLRRSGQLPQAQAVAPKLVLQPEEFARGSSDEADPVQKGDEVSVELEPGVTKLGRVRALFEPCILAISADRQRPRSAEVLVRFDAGGGWFKREHVEFLSRPEQPLEPNLLQRISQDDPQMKTQLASMQQRNGVSGTITDLIAGRSRRRLRSVARVQRPRKQGESVVSEKTREMFRLLMEEETEELQRLLDEGGDITTRNALGQSMCVAHAAVVQPHGKFCRHVDLSHNLLLSCAHGCGPVQVRSCVRKQKVEIGRLA